MKTTNVCPYCSQNMHVSEMGCSECEIHVRGTFATERLSRLPTEHQRFIEMFVLAAGNLKEIAKQTGVSYPTIRGRLNKVIEELRAEILRSHSETSHDSPALGARSQSSEQDSLLQIVIPPVEHQTSAEQAKQLIKSI